MFLRQFEVRYYSIFVRIGRQGLRLNRLTASRRRWETGIFDGRGCIAAKPIVFSGVILTCRSQLAKIDRSKLYGYKEVKVLDEGGNRCELATLADDGRTVVARGGTGLVYVDADGCWSDKVKLKPIDVEGNAIQPVASSFSVLIKLFEAAHVDGDPKIDAGEHQSLLE